ncbi:MAG: VanZ family protein [Sedimentisphaerales bacterium]|nr:VanZ family protein [Sedimentisphaerales bacterium]
MPMVRRQKTLILTLVLYWPAMFVLTHIPVPQVVREAHVSDKNLHFLTYMILAFLLGWAWRSGGNADGRRRVGRWVFLVVMAYALCDEGLQYFVAGRSPDRADLLANTCGTLAGLAVTSFVSFWPGSLIVTGTSIYTLGVLTRANLTRLLPVTSTALHLVTYGLFTLLWMGYLNQSPRGKRPDRTWVFRSSLAPVLLLLVTKISAVVSGKELEAWEIVAAIGGMAVALIGAALWRALSPEGAKDARLSAAEA